MHCPGNNNQRKAATVAFGKVSTIQYAQWVLCGTTSKCYYYLSSSIIECNCVLYWFIQMCF